MPVMLLLLLIEDNPTLREAVSQYLREAGYRGGRVRNGRRGIMGGGGQ